MRSAATIAASSFFFIVCFLFLSFASLPLPCASNPSRRILHQPFVPLDTFPPSLPPSPSPPVPPSTTTNTNTNTTTTPKFPSSSSAPPGTPFFPTFPSPPPPPSPIAFASFPANISSLILPNSPKPHSNSSKLLAVTAAAVISAVIVVGIIVLYYCRRRFQNRKYVDDDKGYRSSDNNTRRHSTQNAEARSSTAPKLRTNSTSSEFLYLGTLVDSTCINDSSNVAMDPRKLDSPELRPLPPLNKQGSRQNCGNGEVESTTGDEEEFYSPRESLGGRDSSSGAGSRSRRVFADVAGADFGRISSDSSSCSCSSSSAGSPSRSISISPPVSLSPQPKLPETVTVQSPSPPRPPPPPSFHGVVLSGDRSSPSLSMVSSSPDRAHVGNTHASRRQSDASDQNSGSDSLASLGFSKVSNPNVRSPSLSPARIDNEINRNIQSLSLSSASTSPDRSWAASPRMSNVFNPNVRSPSLSSASTSPDRCLEKKLVATPRLSNNSLPSTSSSSSSSSPEPVLKKSPALNVKIRSALELPNSVVTPPPPPPPPPPPQRPWESPVEPTPTGKPISKPPSLIPPSRPFVLQSTTKISPVELPPSYKAMENIEETPKPKLKPLHWDKVRASSDREMVWDQLRSSSFKLNEEMIETLFVNKPTPKPKQTTPGSVLPSPNQENRVLDPKKSQNIAILLRAINVTVEEVCDALLEGNADMLGSELLESLLKMAPTKEEERKLKEYKEDSPTKIGHAEKFLKALLDIPFAFRRVDAMLYIANFESEIEYLKKSFETLEAACEELRSSRMFLKLLEAVLKTGNRMNVGTNRGDAQAFKLDTLHKLVDVKGADGKTTLLHFVVQEIIRTEGARLSGTNPTPSSTLSEDAKCRKLGLQVVSGLSSELTNVKKAAAMDSDVLSSEVCKLSRGVENINQVVQLNRTIGSDESTKKFLDSMSRFMKMAEEEIIRIQAQESVAMSLVKEITEYFHGNSAKEEAHPFRIFTVVRDFLTILDRVCKEVGMINERTIVSSAHKFPVPVNPMMPQVFPVNPTLPQAFPGYHARQQQYNSSDDEGASA